LVGEVSKRLMGLVSAVGPHRRMGVWPSGRL